MMQSNANVARRSVLSLLYLLLLGSLILLSACGSSSDSSSSSTSSLSPTATIAPTATATTATNGPTQTVMITTDSSGTFTFSPKTLTVRAGTTVIWKNTTQTPHTVTSDDDKTFNSGDNTPINTNMTFSFTFTKAGTFAYHCDFHTYMMATIVVQ